MGVYNVANIKYEGEEQNARELTQEEIDSEYQTGKIDTSTEDYQEANKIFTKLQA